MAENTLPKKNVAHTFYVTLIDVSSRPDFQVNPTLAAGDVQVSTDGGAFGNLATLPVVTPAGGVAVKVDLSGSEMNGDNVTVKFSDVAGGEWDDLFIELRPATRKAEDLAFPSTSGQSHNLTASGNVTLAAGVDHGGDDTTLKLHSTTSISPLHIHGAGTADSLLITGASNRYGLRIASAGTGAPIRLDPASADGVAILLGPNGTGRIDGSLDDLAGFTMMRSTVASVTSQTEFVITGGPSQANFINGCTVIFARDNTVKAFGTVLSWSLNTRILILKSDPGIFTIAAGDFVFVSVQTVDVDGAGAVSLLEATQTSIDTIETELDKVIKSGEESRHVFQSAVSNDDVNVIETRV